MKKQDKRLVTDCVEAEGFDYCFRYYSEFPEVKDAKFHRLRGAYVAAAKALSDYVGIED